jgi:hypothetical protein
MTARKTLPYLLLTLLAYSSVAFAQSQQGGWIENAASDGIRQRLDAAAIPSFMAKKTGVFTFPPPYNTIGVRLTDPKDCGGGDCVKSVGYSYWRNINNHVGSATMFIFLGLDQDLGGHGPILLTYNKTTRKIAKRPLLDPANPVTSQWGPADGMQWYFSGTLPNALYIFNTGVNRDRLLHRYDVVTKSLTTVFDVGGTFGNDKFFDQPHSSDNDKIHSATLVCDAVSCSDGTNTAAAVGEAMGCLIFDEGAGGVFSYFPREGAGTFDECQIDKSGRWLLIKENRRDEPAPVSGKLVTKLDNRLVDLQNGGATTRLPYGSDPASLLNAMGHSDSGFGYIVGEGLGTRPGTVRLWKPENGSITSSLLYYDHNLDALAAGFITHTNAQSGTPPEKQHACASNGIRTTDDSGQALGPQPRSDEIVCFRLDGSLDVLVVAPVMASVDAPGGGDPYLKMPKGNLDVTGRYFIWTANLFGNRLDAFLVEVPTQLLVGGAEAGAPLPPWDAQDIGDVGEEGAAVFANGNFTVSAAGADIWGTADAFHYVYQPLAGDGQIIAQVGSLQTHHADDPSVEHEFWEKAGVMIRESLDPGAANAMVAVTYRQGAVFQRRKAPNADSINTMLSTIARAPSWIKLTRKGNVFSAFLSKDGKTWGKPVAVDTIPMGPNIFVGLALTSHDATETTLATFDRVSVGPVTK